MHWEWRTVILITCPSAPLVVVIFVASVHLYCYSFVNAVTFLLVIFDWLISPHQVGVPCSFQFVEVYTQGALLYQVSDPWCVMFPRPLDSPLPPYRQLHRLVDLTEFTQNNGVRPFLHLYIQLCKYLTISN